MFLLDFRYWKYCFDVGYLGILNWEFWEIKLELWRYKNGVFLGIFWVLRGKAAALQVMPRPASSKLAINQSVQNHEINAAAWFGL